MSFSILNFNFPLLQRPLLTLRAINLATFPPAVLLLFIHGLISENVNPALGIIPLAFSAALASVILREASKSRCNCTGLAGHPVVLVADVLIATGMLTELILTWVFLGRGYSYDHIMFGTYASNFLILGFGCHAYFALRPLFETLTGSGYYPTSCPQCHFAPFSKFRGQGRRLDGKAAYEPLIAEAQNGEGYGQYQDNAEGTAETNAVTPATEEV